MALGIRVLVDPVTDTKADSHQNGCLVDIVAIHGIGAHPDDTWTGRDANGKKIYWLSNDDKDNPMLPQAIPRARIMRFGYMSDWNGTSGRNKRTYVSDVADMLLRELEFHRRDRVARPIIFIAHSYGGLVLIKALRMSFDSPNRWANPFRSTIGIAFFGTPFRGRRGLSFEQVVDAIAQGDQEQTSSEHRSYPETMALADEENPYLQDIVKRFTETRCGDNPIPLRFFYETLPSPINKIFPPGSGINDGYLVVEDSACLDTSKNIGRYPLQRHHYNLQKFSGPEDPDYRAVERAILELLNGASISVPRELIDRILSTIWFCHMNAREAQIQSVSEETTSWIFDQTNSVPGAEDRHSQFPQWLESEDPVFWISGKPGSGKSSLMKFLVLDSQTKDRLSNWRPDVMILRYFFIEICHVPLQREFRGCLRALLCQLLDSKPHIIGPLIEEIPDLTAKRSEHDWSIKELHHVFFVALRLAKSPICLFLDGLDEIAVESDDRDSVIELVEDLSRLGNVKVCVSSRPENIFESRLNSFPSLQTQDLNRSAIERHIQTRLLEYMPSPRADLERYHWLIAALVNKASGVFLWACLATTSVIRGIENEESWDTLYQRTEELDPNLHRLFHQMWERGNTNIRFYKEDTARLLWHSLHAPSLWRNFPELSTLLGYILATHKDFRFEVLSSDLRERRNSEDALVFEKYSKWIATRGSGFLEITHRLTPAEFPAPPLLINCEVKFIHRSVQEFLVSTKPGHDILLAAHGSSKERLLQTSDVIRDLCVCLPGDRFIVTNYMALLSELGFMGYLTPQEEIERFLDMRSRSQSRSLGASPDFYVLREVARTWNFKLLSYLPGVDKLTSKEKSTLLADAFEAPYIFEQSHFTRLFDIEHRVTGNREFKYGGIENNLERLKATIHSLHPTSAELNAEYETRDFGGLIVPKTPFHVLLNTIAEGLRGFDHERHLYRRLAVFSQELNQYGIGQDLPFHVSVRVEESLIEFYTEHWDLFWRSTSSMCVFEISSRWLQDFLGRMNQDITTEQREAEIENELTSVDFKLQCIGVCCERVRGGEAAAMYRPDTSKVKEKRELEGIIGRAYVAWLYGFDDQYLKMGNIVTDYIELLSQYIVYKSTNELDETTSKPLKGGQSEATRQARALRRDEHEDRR